MILDVVYNHTAELDDKHPYTISFRWVAQMCAVTSLDRNNRPSLLL